MFEVEDVLLFVLCCACVVLGSDHALCVGRCVCPPKIFVFKAQRLLVWRREEGEKEMKERKEKKQRKGEKKGRGGFKGTWAGCVSLNNDRAHWTIERHRREHDHGQQQQQIDQEDTLVKLEKGLIDDGGWMGTWSRTTDQRDTWTKEESKIDETWAFASRKPSPAGRINKALALLMLASRLLAWFPVPEATRHPSTPSHLTVAL